MFGSDVNGGFYERIIYYGIFAAACLSCVY